MSLSSPFSVVNNSLSIYMKPSDFHHLSNEEFNKLRPKSEDETDLFIAEQEYRDWCADDDLDPTDESNREMYNEMREEIDGFWDNQDVDEREGWESMMTD